MIDGGFGPNGLRIDPNADRLFFDVTLDADMKGTLYTLPLVDNPTDADLKKFNPAELLANKKKDLKLADPQVTTLTALKQTINDRNAPFMAHYDSLQRAFKPDASAYRIE